MSYLYFPSTLHWLDKSRMQRKSGHLVLLATIDISIQRKSWNSQSPLLAFASHNGLLLKTSDIIITALDTRENISLWILIRPLSVLATRLFVPSTQSAYRYLWHKEWHTTCPLSLFSVQNIRIYLSLCVFLYLVLLTLTLNIPSLAR